MCGFMEETGSVDCEETEEQKEEQLYLLLRSLTQTQSSVSAPEQDSLSGRSPLFVCLLVFID